MKKKGVISEAVINAWRVIENKDADLREIADALDRVTSLLDETSIEKLPTARSVLRRTHARLSLKYERKTATVEDFE